MSVFYRQAARLSIGVSMAWIGSAMPFTTTSASCTGVAAGAMTAGAMTADKSNSSNPTPRMLPNILKNEYMKGTNVVLGHHVDKYGGVIVDSNQLPSDIASFRSILSCSLDTWRVDGKRGIWLKIPISKAAFIESAVDMGFVFHHAERDYAMLTHWLSSHEENKLPGSATHQAGVGCVIMKDGKILVVQEKNGPLKGSGLWKIPTGLLDLGEDISEGACREALEETGIETEFSHLLCLRQAHNVLFGKSDLFFVCVLRPKSTEIVVQSSELEACEWKDLGVYLSQPLFKQSELHTELNKLLLEYAETEHLYRESREGDMRGEQVQEPRLGLVHSRFHSGFRPGKQSLYHFPTPIKK